MHTPPMSMTSPVAADAALAHSSEATARFWTDLREAVGRAVVGAEEPLRLTALAGLVIDIGGVCIGEARSG